MYMYVIFATSASCREAPGDFKSPLSFWGQAGGGGGGKMWLCIGRFPHAQHCMCQPAITMQVQCTSVLSMFIPSKCPAKDMMRMELFQKRALELA